MKMKRSEYGAKLRSQLTNPLIRLPLGECLARFRMGIFATTIFSHHFLKRNYKPRVVTQDSLFLHSIFLRDSSTEHRLSILKFHYFQRGIRRCVL